MTRHLKRNRDLAAGLFFMGMACLSAGPIPPTVVADSIASGSIFSPGPLTDVITFSEPMNASATTAASFDLHGIGHGADYSPSSFTWDPTDTVLTISYPTEPVDNYTETLFASGFQNLAAQDLVSNYATDFCVSSISICPVQPFVVADSIANGSIFSPGPLTDVITFSEPMNTSATTAASFDLHGVLHGANYSPASFNWDPTGTVLTINYLTTPVDNYTETLFATGFQGLAGLDLASNDATSFCVSSTGACPSPVATPEASSLSLIGFGISGMALASFLMARFRHRSR